MYEPHGLKAHFPLLLTPWWLGCVSVCAFGSIGAFDSAGDCVGLDYAGDEV